MNAAEAWMIEPVGRDGTRGGGGGDGGRETDGAETAAAPGDASRADDAGRDGVDRLRIERVEPSETGVKRLLAAAEAPADALSALFTPPAPPPPSGLAAPAGAEGGSAPVERRIADIADRVERSLMADLAAENGAPIALRIPLDGALDGLSSLTVTATAQGLDIVLAREAGAEPSAELVAAAQNLADRLQRRLGRGAVRVFEGVAESAAAAPAAEGWAGLSAILGRGTV